MARITLWLAASVAVTIAAAGAPAWACGDDQTVAAGARATAVAPGLAVAFSTQTLADFARSPAPVLAPAALTAEQAAAFARSFRATPDGFFARLTLERFDVVVNGTCVSTAAPGRPAAPTGPSADVRISGSETGLAASFRRYGAAYEVEFACRGAGDELGAACVSREQASAFIDGLVRVGGGAP